MSFSGNRQVFSGMMNSSNGIRRYNFPKPGENPNFEEFEVGEPPNEMFVETDENELHYDDAQDGDMWEDTFGDQVNGDANGEVLGEQHHEVTIEDVDDDNDDFYANDNENDGTKDLPDERSSHQILGLDDMVGSRSELEKRVRDIVFPRVEVMEHPDDPSFIKEITHRLNSHDTRKRPPSEFLLDGKGDLTVSQFALALNAWSAVHGHSNASTNDLLRILRDSIPGINLPLKKADKTPFADKEITSNTILQYQKVELKTFPINVCRRECMAFHGKQIIGKKMEEVDCSKLLKCYVCKDPRYTKCGHKTCIKNGTEFKCSPFVDKKDKTHVYHSEKSRTAMKVVFCRSIIIKLIELYCLSLMEGFEGILDYNKRRVKKNGKIIDILDGAEVQTQQRKMDKRFKKARKEFKRQAPDLKLRQCSLILTAFYDGVVNFKRRADSMWPLMISVADCNPSHRSKIGVGLFLTILHNLSVGSGAEKYLIQEIFTQELVKLENGILFTIPAQEGFKERHVFLQARLVFMHLDTKALEKFGCVKMCNSALGCAFCNSQSGCYRAAISKYVYGNTRINLHERHVLRPLGQREFEDEVDFVDNQVVVTVTAADKAKMYYDNHKDYREYFVRDKAEKGEIVTTSMDKVSEADKATLLRRMELKRSRDWDEERDVVWYHTDERFAPHNFLNCARYPFPERRQRRIYKRRPNRDYLKNGMIARRNRAHAETTYATGTKRPKTAKDFSSRGVHEIAPIIEFTDAFKIHNLGPDGMHMFGNANNNFTRVYKGERGLQPGSRDLSFSQEKHPVLQYTQTKADWECTQSDQDFMDAIVNGFFVPAAYSNDFRIRNPMKQRGFMKSKDHYNYLIAYASFVMSFTDVAPDYVAFMAMYADDMCHLFDPHLSASSLSLLMKKVMETRSTQEGLFPESEQIFIFHEIVDIVNHILKFGHIRGLMCYSGERANGEISSCVSKGGVNYLLTLFNRYVWKENSCLKYFLFADETNYDNRGVYSDFALKLYGKSEILVKPFGAIKATTTAAQAAAAAAAEYSNLFKVVYCFLQTQGLVESELFASSPFYRLYSAFLFTTGTPNEFYNWLVKFDKAINNNNHNAFLAKNNKLCKRFVFDSNEDDTEKDFLSCANGVVYFSDLRAVAECILPLTSFQMYTSLIVKGIKFKCRGTKFMETAGPHNKLKKCYEWRKHYSCIARVKHYQVEERDKTDTIVASGCKVPQSTAGLKDGHSLHIGYSIKFAWLNCAFRLNMPCDPLIHGLAIAHCALRDGKYIDKRWQYSVNVEAALLSADRFVCLNYVDSTPIVSSAFNSAGKVLLRRGDLSSFTANSLPNLQCYSTRKNNTLAFLYMIPIRPERLTLTYDNVLRDSDHTLTLEKDCVFLDV